MPTEEMIVLANSRKMGGRCVAGISIRTGEWVRPVSDRDEGELYPYHCRVDGRQPRLLDIVRFSYLHALDDPIQPENLLLEDEQWELVGALDPNDAYAELDSLLASGPELLGNCDRAVEEGVAKQGVDKSLALIEPSNPVVFVVKPPFRPGQRAQARVTFILDGQAYDLPVTDFPIAAQLREAGSGSYELDDVGLADADHTLFTVSLGLPMKGSCWKLAAAFLSVS